MEKVYIRTYKLFTRSFIALLMAAVFASNGMAQPTVIFKPYLDGFSQPLDVVNAGDGSNRLFVVQKGGLVRIVKDSAIVGTFANFTSRVKATGGEQGLLSMAFHPLYETNRMFFIYYTNAQDDIEIARFRTRADNPDLVDDTTGKILLTIPKGPTNHNGGKLNFGPDGYLYFATGDGGDGGDPNNNAQNGNSLLGKVLRLDVDSIETAPYYTIPPTNPYVTDPNIRDEIWALGLRNPWRWSFDRQTNDMWIADVGQGAWEELNWRPAGSTGGVNYGWRCYEGNHAYNTTGCQPQSSYIAAIYEYPHNATGGISVTGGYVYRGNEFPNLRGTYLMSDFGSGHLWKVAPNGSGGWNVSQQLSILSNVVGYGESENGRLFAHTIGGTLYLVTSAPDAPLPVTLVSFQAQPGNGVINLTWETSFEQDIRHFEVEFSEDNIDFTQAGIVKALNNTRGEVYRFQHTVFNKQRVYYRLRMVDLDGTAEYSRTLTVEVTGSAKNYVFPTIGTNGTVGLYLSETFENVEIIDIHGKLLRKQSLSGRTGRIDIQLPIGATGTVVVRLNHLDRGKSFTQKVFVR